MTQNTNITDRKKTLCNIIMTIVISIKSTTFMRTIIIATSMAIMSKIYNTIILYIFYIII